jgi:hypothetical protein
MKQTAVLLVMEELSTLNGLKELNGVNGYEYFHRLKKIEQKCLTMEKEQKEDFFNAGVRYGSGSVMATEWGEDTEEYNFEQYYNETFKSE